MFHGEVGLIFVGNAKVVGADDVGVIKEGRGLEFGFKAVDVFLFMELAGKHFESELCLSAGIVDKEYSAHPAHAELFKDMIAIIDAGAHGGISLVAFKVPKSDYEGKRIE